MNIASAKALVTGGSSGIGMETARLLISRGARVAICGRDRARLDLAANEIGALPIHADVSVETDVVRMIWTVVDTFGEDYNVLINNAGFGSFAPLVETTLEEMQPGQCQRGADPLFRAHGRERPLSPRKLQATDIAGVIVSMLEMEDRGFVTETTVWGHES